MRDRVKEALRVRFFVGPRRGDLWVEDDESSFGAVDTEFTQVKPDRLVVHVGDRSFMLTLEELVLPPAGPAPIEGQLELG